MISMSTVDGLSFALPPSMGFDSVRELARSFAGILYEAGFSTVVPMKSYEKLEKALMIGEVHAAWGPPMVCARVEHAGGRAVFRAKRFGATSYRSVLLCRSHDDLDVDELGKEGLRRPKAVWVDQWSMGGYILPRHHLRSLGVDPVTAFCEEELLGSYKECFQAVIDGVADVTASYANRRGLGYVEMCRDEAFHLRTLAYTGESPNDAIVLSPVLGRDAPQVVAQLDELMNTPTRKQILAETLNVDDFDRPDEGVYEHLLELL
jgi:ABC-type phosphate/phosphonate transport system substrate-binding protein